LISWPKIRKTTGAVTDDGEWVAMFDEKHFAMLLDRKERPENPVNIKTSGEGR
jgi:hypothetical protein